MFGNKLTSINMYTYFKTLVKSTWQNTRDKKLVICLAIIQIIVPIVKSYRFLGTLNDDSNVAQFLMICDIKET